MTYEGQRERTLKTMTMWSMLWRDPITCPDWMGEYMLGACDALNQVKSLIVNGHEEHLLSLLKLGSDSAWMEVEKG